MLLAQTPQAFRRDILNAAIELGQKSVDATDEAALAEQAGFEVDRIIEARVNFGALDPQTAWEANLYAAGHAAARALTAEQQAELRRRYLDALRQQMDTRAEWSSASVLFAIGRRR